MKIDDIRPYTRNPRRIGAAEMTRLKASIQRDPAFMRLRPIVVDGDGMILGGNQRWRACKELGMVELPDGWVVKASDLTPDQRKRFVLVDNAPAGMAGDWDLDTLKADWGLTDLEALGFDVSALRDPPGGADAPPQMNRAEELNAKWAVKPGDLWAIGEHRLICGDSTDPATIDRVMMSERATLVFTDPPYGVGAGKKSRDLPPDAHGKRRKSYAQKWAEGWNHADIEDDDLTPAQLKDRLVPAFVNIRERVMGDDCTVFVTAPQSGELSMMMMMMMMQEAGLQTRHVLIWKKDSPTFSMGRLDYDYQHEPILLTWGKRHKRPMLGQHRSSVWEIPKPRESKEHPTMKPVELVVNALMNNSDPGDVSFDAYAGSGTSLVAAQNTGRKCRAVEIAPHYCAVILERMFTAFPELEVRRLS